MHWFPWQLGDRLSLRHAMIMLLLATVIAGHLPIPVLPAVNRNGKDRSQPFPCQDRPCGCRSAEQCKKKCCCFSKDQKVAWARRNGVKVSDVVAVTAKRESTELKARQGCCSIHRTAKSGNGDQSAPHSTKTASRCKIVIGVVAQECQGVAQTLFGQSVFLIPQVAPLNPLVGSRGERFILEGTRFVQPVAEPPVPPPRLVAA